MRLLENIRAGIPRPPRGIGLRVAVAVATAGVVAVGLVVAADPAAAVAGLQFISGQSATDSAAFKSLIVTCPAGTQGLGGSVRITGSTQVRIYTVEPSSTNVYFAVTEPEEGVATTWSFSAQAVCAPTASLPGLQYVRAGARADVLARGGPVTVQALARCPAGKGVIGMGTRVDAIDLQRSEARTKAHLNTMKTDGVPGHAGEQAVGRASAAGYEGSVGVIAIAACVTVSQVPRLQWIDAATTFNSIADKQARVACPAGTTLHGGGFSVNSNTADLVGASIGVTQLSFGSDVQTIARESTAQTTKDWQLFAVGICA